MLRVPTKVWQLEIEKIFYVHVLFQHVLLSVLFSYAKKIAKTNLYILIVE
jgi:hypothetical protein